MSRVLWTSWMVAACGGSVAPDVVIPETTRVLQADALDELQEASADLTTLVFDVSSGLADLETGDVLVADVHPQLPYGMLRRVTQVTADNQQLVVTTAQASLAEAIERGSLDETFTLDESMIVGGRRGPPPNLLEGGFFYAYNDYELFDADGDPSTTHDRVWLDGSFSFRPTLRFRIDIDGFSVDTFQFEISAEQEASIRLEAGREATFDEAELIDSYELTPITFTVGPVPVVLIPRLELWVGVDGVVTANMVAGANGSAQPALRLGYANGSWTPDTDLSPFAEFDVPSFRDGAEGEVRVWAGPRAELAAYGIAGVEGTIRAYVRAEVASDADPWWTLWAGIEPSVGVFVEVLDATIAEYQEPLASTEVRLADAGGPAPSAGNELVTWSRTFSGALIDAPGQIVATPDDGLLVGATTNSFQIAPADAWLLKLDRLGQISWQTALRGGQGVLNLVVDETDGSMVAALGATADGTDVSMLVGLDTNGTLQWVKRLGHPEANVAIKGLASAPGGHFVAVGALGGGGGADMWAARFDGAGQLVWARSIGGKRGDTPKSLVRDGDHYVAVGSTGSFGVTNIGGFAVGFDADGALEWQRVYDQPASGNEVFTSVQVHPEGYRIGGHIFGEAIVVDVGPAGAIREAHQFASGSPYNRIFSGSTLDDGGALLAGVSGLGDTANAWLLRTTAIGSVLWSTEYGGPDREGAGGITSAADQSEAIAMTDDGGFAVAAHVQRDDTSWDLWVFKVSGTGVISFDDPTYAATALSGSFGELGLESSALTKAWGATDLQTEDAELETYVPNPVEAVQATP